MPPPVPASGRVVFPLPQGTRVAASPFRMRVDPTTGVTKLHPSAADGIVTAGQRIGNVDSADYSPGGRYGYAHITVEQGNQPWISSPTSAPSTTRSNHINAHAGAWGDKERWQPVS